METLKEYIKNITNKNINNSIIKKYFMLDTLTENIKDYLWINSYISFDDLKHYYHLSNGTLIIEYENIILNDYIKEKINNYLTNIK